MEPETTHQEPETPLQEAEKPIDESLSSTSKSAEETVNTAVNTSYGAAQITTLKGVRKAFDIKLLLEEVKKRGDAKKLVEKYHFKNHSILARALNEARILNIFPDIEKSKSSTLSTFRVSRELDYFTKLYNIYELSARELKTAVLEWKRLISRNPQLLLTKKQHEVLMGMLLGDGNLRQRGRNTLFRTEHSEKQKEYLFWTYRVFKEFTLSEPKKAARKHHKNNEYSFTTFAHPVFNFYLDLFYKKGRKQVTLEILKLLTPESLSVWICDDGSYSNSGKHIILCTNSFSLEEHKLMQKYFKEQWNLNCSIRFRDKKYYYLSFYKADTQKLANIIQNYIPLENLRYKIGEKND